MFTWKYQQKAKNIYCIFRVVCAETCLPHTISDLGASIMRLDLIRELDELGWKKNNFILSFSMKSGRITCLCHFLSKQDKETWNQRWAQQPKLKQYKCSERQIEEDGNRDMRKKINTGLFPGKTEGKRNAKLFSVSRPGLSCQTELDVLVIT